MRRPCRLPDQRSENYKDLVLRWISEPAKTLIAACLSGFLGAAGYEVQIWKAQPAGYNTGSIVGAGKTDREYKFLPDQWNHYEITADGDHLMVVLNGTKTLDVHDSQFSKARIRLQYQKYPDRVQEHQGASHQALIRGYLAGKSSVFRTGPATAAQRLAQTLALFGRHLFQPLRHTVPPVVA